MCHLCPAPRATAAVRSAAGQRCSAKNATSCATSRARCRTDGSLATLRAGGPRPRRGGWRRAEAGWAGRAARRLSRELWGGERQRSSCRWRAGQWPPRRAVVRGPDTQECWARTCGTSSRPHRRGGARARPSVGVLAAQGCSPSCLLAGRAGGAPPHARLLTHDAARAACCREYDAEFSRLINEPVDPLLGQVPGQQHPGPRTTSAPPHLGELARAFGANGDLVRVPPPCRARVLRAPAAAPGGKKRHCSWVSLFRTVGVSPAHGRRAPSDARHVGRRRLHGGVCFGDAGAARRRRMARGALRCGMWLWSARAACAGSLVS